MSDLIVRDATLLSCVDGSARDRQEHVDVVVRDGLIAEVRRTGHAIDAGTTVVEANGATLMPGLTDAHVHLALIGPTGDHGDLDWVSHVLTVSRVIEETLQEGFTTVRDVGGLDPAFARAVGRGQVPGPHILSSGSVISQVGGHGDLREAHEAVHHAGPSIPGLVARPEVVTGADEVRRVAREQLRKGADHLKVFASGGVLSPTDHWSQTQFQLEELRAAVEVAEAWGTYVAAHCHSEAALTQVIEAGIRSIEHGSQISPEIAAIMAERDVFLVPTLRVLQLIAAQDDLTASQRSDINQISDGSRAAIRAATDAGAGVGSGSDLVGPDQTGRGHEIVLKAEVMGPMAAILSATRDNARLFRMTETIGSVEPGKRADLILLGAHPLDDVAVLADGANIRTIVQAGKVVKDLDGKAHDE